MSSKNSLDNRTGAVFEQVITLLQSRWHTRKSNDDKFTVIMFDLSAQIACERVELNSIDNIHDIPKEIEEKCFDKVTWGGTNFGEAIYQAEQVMNKYKNDQFVLMFLSDGECDDCWANNDNTLTASQRVRKLNKILKNLHFMEYNLELEQQVKLYKKWHKMVEAM